MMLHSVVSWKNHISIIAISATGSSSRSLAQFKTRACLKNRLPLLPKGIDKSSVVHDSLRLLEWDKLCDSVASFAGTSLGKEATKAQLWSPSRSYEESMRLLDETNAAVEIHKYGGSMDFSCIDIVLVKSAMEHAQRSWPVDGREAMAVVALIQFAENLQFNLKAAIKEDTEWYPRFMPLSKMIMEMVISRSLVKLIHQLMDGDGSVKDSASPALKRARDQVRVLERKLFQLLDSIRRNEMKDTSTSDVTDIDGRLCIRLGPDLPANFDGLLLSSGSGRGSVVEPFSAVSLNDGLQQAKALAAKAEADVLLKITEKMQDDLGDVQNLCNSLIQLDVINARATYSLSFGGACPDLFLPETKEGGLAFDDSAENKNSVPSYVTERKWTLYLPRSYHPLLLQQHGQNLKKAMKAVSNATAEIRRAKLQGEIMSMKEEADTSLSSLQTQVTKLEQAHPVPVDIFVAQGTRVLVITGPNTGGKTIFLKTVGLAAVMAKSGLYVLSSEPVKIPWFDCVFADIGDEQSLSQSLSTFSGHLKQISEILKHSTSHSLVLLDEVGAGTNPLEGAALGMSLLESLSESGPLLTMATTHHGELKTLKYSNEAIENACMEFDEEKLRPTYQILWGVPGRSNALNIAERLGLPDVILHKARELYGAASAEINEVILDMEKLKHNLRAHIQEAQNYLKLSRDLHENLRVSRRKVVDHGSAQRYRKMQEISELAAVARSLLHKKVQEIRASTIQSSQPVAANNSQNKFTVGNQHAAVDNTKFYLTDKAASSSDNGKQSLAETRVKLPKVGDVVRISSFDKEATVLKVEPSKEEIFVQVGKMKLKLKLADLSA